MSNTVTCFLIDDDEDDQEIFAIALRKVNADIKCVFADDALDALQKLAQNEDFVPQYIFLDLNMPGMDGIQCLTELKKIDRLRSTPIIMYSTSAEPKDVHETRKLGASEFITKPPLVSMLTDKLASLFVNR